MIRSLNIWWATWAVLVALSVAGVPGSALAQSKRVAVLDFKGTNASAVQAQITAGLREQGDIELVSARDVKSAADRAGTSLGTSSSYKTVAAELEISAFVEGEVAKKGHRLQATVRVINGANGSELHEETWSRRTNGVKTIKPTVWTALGPAIEQSAAPKSTAKKETKPAKKPPPPPPPPPVAEDDEEEEEEEEEVKPAKKPQRRVERERDDEEEEEREERPAKKRDPGNLTSTHPSLIAYFAPRIMWRTLQYEGSPTSTEFQTYSSTDEGTPSFNLNLGAQWYPGAYKRKDWLSDLGAELDIDYALGLKAKVAETNRTVSVKAYELGIGAIYRIPLDAFEPRFRLGFVKHVFDVDVPNMPGLSYNNIRIGAGTAINLVDWLSFDVNFAYLLVLSAGELEDKDKGEDVSTKAWEAGFGALVRFNETWGGRLAIDYRRYKYDFGLSDNPEVVLPKSGTDGYLRLTLAVVVTLPGQAK